MSWRHNDVIKLTFFVIFSVFCIKIALNVLLLAEIYILAKQITPYLIGNLMRIPKMVLKILSDITLMSWWRHNDVNLTSKMIENAQNRHFLLCKWSQYHFIMVFMVVYIDFCSLLVCQIHSYWGSTHIDVNRRQFNVENDRNWSKIRKIVNFCHVYGLNTTFQSFLWWFTSISTVC